MTAKDLLRFTTFVREEVQSDINIQQLDILLRVAANEGITQPDLREQTGLMAGSVSRHLSKLSYYKHPRDGSKAGLGLIRQSQSFENRREFAVFLTTKGKQLIKQIEGL